MMWTTTSVRKCQVCCCRGRFTVNFRRSTYGRDPPFWFNPFFQAGFLKEMCAKAGFVGNYTNCSGKATCATELFNQTVHEQLIMRQTGNRSNSVRSTKSLLPVMIYWYQNIASPSQSSKDRKNDSNRQMTIRSCQDVNYTETARTKIEEKEKGTLVFFRKRGSKF